MRSYIGGNKRNARRGFVLPAVIFSIAIMSIIVVVALSTSEDERRASRAMRESTLATYAAESGMRKTLGALPTVSMTALNPGDSLDLAWQTMPNKAAYRAVIHRVDAGGAGTTPQYLMVVQGRRTGINGGQSTIVTQITNGGTGVFQYGVFSQGKLVFGGSGSLSDSYDSDVSNYTAGTANSNGDIYGDSVVVLNASTVIKGDVTAALTATGGIVSGVVTQNAPKIALAPVKPCPAVPYTAPADLAHFAGSGASMSHVGELVVPSGAHLVLDVPPTQYFFKDLSVTGGGSISFNNPTNQHVDIYVEDQLVIGGGGIVNATAKSTLVGMVACGSMVKPGTFTLTGGSDAYFTVYAPDRDVGVGGGGDLYGAVIGKTVTINGGSRMHYDEALARQGGTGVTAVAGAWAQMPGN
jgi:type II secretory pathway pseudopilin PulG